MKCKCKWYADFEGVCTNGECPYCGDVCPTSEYPDVCKYAEKQTEQTEQPEIPQLSVEDLVKALRLCGSASCTGCALYGLRQHHKSASRRHARKAGGGEGREEAGVDQR